jgi:hypothetical protein
MLQIVLSLIHGKRDNRGGDQSETYGDNEGSKDTASCGSSLSELLGNWVGLSRHLEFKVGLAQSLLKDRLIQELGVGSCHIL